LFPDLVGDIMRCRKGVCGWLESLRKAACIKRGTLWEAAWIVNIDPLKKDL
jgi:hypothetical protein